jgi:hypothetical protein
MAEKVEPVCNLKTVDCLVLWLVLRGQLHGMARLNRMVQLTPLLWGLSLATWVSGPTFAQESGNLSACWKLVVGAAGYYGFGPLAFDKRNPRWNSLDPALVQLLRTYSTLRNQEFGTILDQVELLKKFAPWEDRGFLRLTGHADPETGAPELRYAGSGFASSPRTVPTPTGFNVQAVLTFDSSFGSVYIEFYCDSQAHRNAIASLYSFWLSQWEARELESLEIFISSRYSPTAGERLKKLRVGVASADALKKWLLLLEKDPTENPDLQATIRDVMERAVQKPSAGIDDLLPSLPTPSARNQMQKFFTKTQRHLFGPI